MDYENTFEDLETDRRYKQLERDLKVAVLKKDNRKNTHNENPLAMPSPITSSFSSINGDSLDLSFVQSSLQGSRVNSEILASSRNLRNTLLRKKIQNCNQKIMATSSIKEYDVKQNNSIDRIIMPPPACNTVYHNSEKQQSRVKDFTLKDHSNYTAIDTYKREYPDSLITKVDSMNNLLKIDRVFTRWRVTLNSQNQLTIKGILECGRAVRSKPVVKRITATCVESIFKYRYSLQGNIVDERNELPDYIRGKFYNGFPDDWENVYQIWRTFVSQGSRVTFRWPTPITDSDDDLKSEVTDLTYVANDKHEKNPYKMMKSDKQLSRSSITKSSEKKEEYPNYTYDLPSHRENYLNGKSITSDTKKDASSLIHMKNEDNLNTQSIKTSVTPSCSFNKTNQLENISQDELLDEFLNNLNDKDCPPHYIKKIMDKLLSKLLISPTLVNYFQDLVSRMIELKDNSDLIPSTSRETPKSETIPLQQIFICNKDNHVNTDKVEDRIRRENHIQSFDPDSGNIKCNNSDPVELLNTKNIRLEHGDHKNLDESESEMYTGIRKIPIERVFRTIELSRKRHERKRKARKITIHPNTKICNANPRCNTKICECADHMKVPKTNIERNLLANESCVSITEDEERLKTKEQSMKSYYKTNSAFTQHSQDMISPKDKKKSSHTNREDANVNEELTLLKNQMRHETQEDLRSQAAYISYKTNSNERKMTLTNKQDIITEDNRIIAVPHSNPSLSIINVEHNTNFLKKPLGDLHKEVTDRTSEIVTDKSKPRIISSVPSNLNLKIDKNFVSVIKPKQSHDSYVHIEPAARRHMNMESKEESYKRKFTSGTSISIESSTIAKNPSIINNNKRNVSHNDFKYNDNLEVNNINCFNSNKLKSEQYKNNKAGSEKNPKVLSVWTPKIISNSKSKSELGLIFEGQLHNEAGHIAHRKFSTDIVLRRVSATLIETVNNEFYELRGCLNDNKHAIPKELVEQCRNGCPSKIEEFCMRWKTLQAAQTKNNEKIVCNALTDAYNIPVSSRGRKKLPTLCYWTGERIKTLKGDIPVYDPGNSQESSLTSLSENSKQILDTENIKNQNINIKNMQEKETVKEPELVTMLNKVSDINKDKLSKTETVGSIKRSKKFGKSRKDITNSKRRVAQHLTYSSSNSSPENVSSPRKYVPNYDTNTNTEQLSKYTMKLRKRQKIDAPNKIPSMERKLEYGTIFIRSPTIKHEQNVMSSYYKNISLKEDFLSEDQISQI